MLHPSDKQFTNFDFSISFQAHINKVLKVAHNYAHFMCALLALVHFETWIHCFGGEIAFWRRD